MADHGTEMDLATDTWRGGNFHYSDCRCPRCANPWTPCPQMLIDVGPPKSESQQRKETPIYSGPMTYFPLALAAVARLCFKANEKHNPGERLHWSRHKSTDHKDCIARHLLAAGTLDEEFDELHDVALTWRAMANLELAEEKRLGITKETK